MTYRSGRSPDWLKSKNPACEAVRGRGRLGALLGAQRALGCGEHQPVANYSAGRDIVAESEPSTGTKLDIAATDHIRPIVTTTTIPTMHARICILLYVLWSRVNLLLLTNDTRQLFS